MGNATNLILIMCTVYLLCGIVAISIYDIDPSSPYLFGNHVFNLNNNYLVQSGVSSGSVVYNGAGSIRYNYNESNTGISSLGANAVVGGSQGVVGAVTGFLFPDWIRAGWNWITSTGKMFVNVIGAPFGLIAGIVIDSTLASLLQAFFGMITLFIIINWILGRDV